MPALLGDEDADPVEQRPPPNAWHLSADRVPIPQVPTSGRARQDEIERHRRLLRDDLYYDDRYAADSTLLDTWLRDEHNVRRASYFVTTASGPRRAREVRGRRRVCGLTPTPSPSLSPSPPPPPRMTEEEEARLMQRVIEDSMMTHDERQWSALDRTMALSTSGDVAIPEQMEEEEVAAFPPDLDASPREEVLQAPASFQPALAHQGPPAHLSTPPTYVDFVSDGDDNDTDGQ
ncbi:ADP-ribosylation factor-related protein 1 [Hordeum vulgare]|nr:ADP-ribosylation factor-related protein 1 [Hordeum vulgare]